ncbi:DUF3560 domain-containing protein [Cryobacterium sp. 10S3]|uniref:DUF3560 domain-containing protein n=1 Tax=unclassified Cryobacterium TaxID=2649013 RepID=UPI002AB4FA37|nr:MULTISPECIES: DUF3560 domain-containing protein [unclassified Cryobacterium]MDY7544585.1 DUF3560 domain-containing protein [Cryobacterium sp. 5B3]MEB0000080.1 DUF3560 domain-containing protein [Cryobacterium sp. RTS3]MEB0266781.1 DUF3560 domain-containing protein [Cryobacterium sp. 10I5]MEB0275977.1 DUF3560 domain-containing protein [Cryobacterium sp. 5B3]MEB0288646.1 DUF3560 domain-containing protein [Cryobacterium sp. 10S3]
MLTITHTHEAGTLIAGTSRGDGTADVLKSAGWRWGRSISAWFVPQSRDRLPKLHTITGTKTALEAAGFEVETDIDSSHRTTADVEAGKIERQADRVDALAVKAERKSRAEEAAWANAQAAHNRLPEGGEPIKVGHHSEVRHRNAIVTADNAMRKSVEASEDATTAQARADAATHTTNARYSPVTVANRIETLGSELRKLERRITAPFYDDTRGYIDATAEQMTSRAERLAPHVGEKRDRIAYWEAVRVAQVESGTATGYDRSTVRKGDRVRIRGQWREVVRANAKTVSVTTGYTWTDTAPYAEIQQLVRPE